MRVCWCVGCWCVNWAVCWCVGMDGWMCMVVGVGIGVCEGWGRWCVGVLLFGCGYGICLVMIAGCFWLLVMVGGVDGWWWLLLVVFCGWFLVFAGCFLFLVVGDPKFQPNPIKNV